MFLIAISQQLSAFRAVRQGAARERVDAAPAAPDPEELAYVRDALKLSDEEIHAVAARGPVAAS